MLRTIILYFCFLLSFSTRHPVPFGVTWRYKGMWKRKSSKFLNNKSAATAFAYTRITRCTFPIIRGSVKLLIHDQSATSDRAVRIIYKYHQLRLTMAS